MSRQWLVVVALVVAAAGCQRMSTAPTASAVPAVASAQPTVTVVAPQRKKLYRTVEQPGTVQAFEETPLYAKLPGYVRRVAADIGDVVKGPRFNEKGEEVEPGQVLAEIAIPELEAEARQKQTLVRQAEVEVEQAGKALQIAQATVAVGEAIEQEARAGLKRAQANYERWQSESQRTDELVKNKVLDPQTRDETLNQFRAAESARTEAHARVASAVAGLRKSKAEADKAEVDVHAAEAHAQVARDTAARLVALLTYTKVRAPFDGVVTRRRVDTGHFLQPGTGGKGEPLFTVVRGKTVRVFVEVPEADADLIRPGDVARVAIQALRGKEFTGTVTRIAWALEPGARTLRTEIDLPNPDGKLRPGMYAYAHIRAELPQAWALPTGAVVRQGDATFCFRVEDGKAVRTPVRTGRSDGQFTEVSEWQAGPSGKWTDFTGTEEIVADNTAALTDGQAVQVVPNR